MAYSDSVGEVASSNVDRNLERISNPVRWRIVVSPTRDGRFQATIKYRVKTSEKDSYEINFVFTPKELRELLPEGAEKFALSNLLGDASRCRDEIRYRIDYSMRKYYNMLGIKHDDCLASCLHRFTTDKELASCLRKAAMLESLIVMMKKPICWSGWAMGS